MQAYWIDFTGDGDSALREGVNGWQNGARVQGSQQ